MKIILASGSPRRKELIRLLSDDVTVIPSGCEECVPEKLGGSETVLYLSRLKGLDVKEKCAESGVVVSADTVVCLDDELLGKPGNAEEAFSMLSRLSGRVHTVYTGVTLIYGEKEKSFFESSEVEFWALSADEINDYIKTGEPFDKAGAYGIQGKGALLVKKINGDFYNVMGLPVSRLKRELEDILR